MANNRMYLKNTRTGERFYLAKYYPSTGWYIVGDNLDDRLNEFFDVQDFGGGERPRFSMGDMYGAEWVLQFQDDGTPLTERGRSQRNL